MGCNCSKTNKKPSLSDKAKSIIVGWKNLITGKYKNDPLVSNRAKICYKCKYKTNNNFCKICKCYIPAKITVKDEKCPKLWW